MKSLLSLCLCLVLALGARAQSSAVAEPDSAFAAGILRLQELMDGDQMVELMTAQMLDMMKSSMLAGSPDMPEGMLDDMIKLVRAEMLQSISQPDGLLRRMDSLYTKYYTHEDVLGMIAFYESPVGRKMITVMPALVSESGQLAVQWVQEMMPSLQIKMEQMLRERGY